MAALSRDLALLKKTEEKVLSSSKNFFLTLGHAREIMRVIKGFLLGYALGHLLLRSATLGSSLILFVIAAGLSFVLMKFERRHYNRGNNLQTLHKTLTIFVICGVASLIVLFYAGPFAYLTLVSMTWIFSTVSYSLE